MNWNELLEKWESGNYFSFPNNLKGKFQWNTSVLKNKGKSKYLEEFIVNNELPKSQDLSAFKEYVKKSKINMLFLFPIQVEILF